MQAGQLEIEILASVARLQEDMRNIERTVSRTTSTISRDARAANDNLRGIGKGAGTGVQEYSRDVARLKAELDPAWASTQRFKQQQDLLTRAWREGAITATQYRQQLIANANAFKGTTQAMVGQTNAMRAGFQNAGYQISDFAVQVGGGTSAIRAASQQAPQLIQAISMMGAGADGAKGKFATFAAFMGGPWGAAITVAISVLGALATSYYSAADASDTKKDAAEDLVDALDDLHGATVREMQSTWQSIQVDIDKANSLRTRANEARNAAIAELELAKAAAERFAQARRFQTADGAGGGAARGALGALEGKYRNDQVRLDAEIREQEARINKANETIRLQRGKAIGLEVAAGFDGAAAASLKYDKALDRLNSRLQAGTINEAAYRAELTQITAVRNAETEAANRSERASTRRSGNRTTRLTAEQRAVQQQARETERFIETLENEIAKLGLDEQAIRQLEVAREIAAAQTQTEKDRIAELNAERERKIALLEREKRVDEANKQTDNMVKQLDALHREAQVLGMVGWERERMLLQLEREAELKPLVTKLTSALANGEYELAEAIQKQIDLLHERYGLEIQMGDRVDQDVKAEEALHRYNDELRRTISMLEQAGALGGVLGGLLGVFSGNTDVVGGPIGDLLNITTEGTKIDAYGREVSRTLGDELTDIFKLDGTFGKTMKSLFGGAATGLTVGNAFGFDSTKEQFGSAIGGALGQVAGEKIGEMVGGTLGKALGPIGSILGGLAGGLLGSLFTKKAYGGAQITGVDQINSFGNDSSRRSAAGTLAGEVVAGLQNLAEAFGAEIGSFNTSIGIYKDKYRVRTDGGTKLGGYSGSETSNESMYGLYNFGEDAAAAVKFAIADAVRDGALLGLRAGTERLIKGDGDLERQLQKALDFESVFSQLREETDPLGFALDNLSNQFDRLRAIFDEAGATAEEYAQLEQLMEIRRQDAMEKARQEEANKLSETRELQIRILELLGREEEALAAARDLELKGMKESLIPLQQVIYQLEDARAIMAQIEPLAADLRAFKQELLGGSAQGGLAFLAGRFRDTAALAKNGDVTALAQLREVSSEYLDAAKDNAASRLDYDRAVGEVLGAVDDGIFAADAQIEYAQMQIDAVNANSDILKGLREDMKRTQERLVAQGEWIERTFRRWDGEGLLLRSDPDAPLYTQEAV